MQLTTLRKRHEFLRVRGGGRFTTQAFVMEAKERSRKTEKHPALCSGPRFGFTVTKRLGNAVKRNRIRRRLKAVLQEVADNAAKDHFDYVIIARPAAYDMPFAALSAVITKAFEHVHRPTNGRRRNRGKKPEKGEIAQKSGG